MCNQTLTSEGHSKFVLWPVILYYLWRFICINAHYAPCMCQFVMLNFQIEGIYQAKLLSVMVGRFHCYSVPGLFANMYCLNLGFGTLHSLGYKSVSLQTQCLELYDSVLWGSICNRLSMILDDTVCRNMI